MNVIGFQLDIAWENKTENYSRVSRWFRQSHPAPGTLVVLPEMFATGFSMQAMQTQESQPSPTIRFLSDLARQYQIAIVAGLVLTDAAGRPRNESVFISPSGEVGCRYAKIQTFTLAGETQHYTPGDAVQVFTYGGFKIAPFVCYDLRFPELFRLAVDQGAEVLTVIANWPVVRVGHWRTLLQARAIENQAYVVGINRTGKDPTLSYNGQSLIIDPLGEILADGGEQEGVVKASLDREIVKSWRARFPALADRRNPRNPQPGHPPVAGSPSAATHRD